jgi:UDP-N-acetylmuramate dehydrogenase
VTAWQVITAATLQLQAGDVAKGRATIREIVQWRREHQPGGQNAGSVFTNPAEDPEGRSAGWLIEAAGCKGQRSGSAVVSEKHANFIQADAGGSADDIAALIAQVQAKVLDRFGVHLRPELRLVGFDDLNPQPSTSMGRQN